jgi:hypothetical protein
MSDTIVGAGQTVTGGTITFPSSLEVESGGTANGVTLIGTDQGEGVITVDAGGVTNGAIVDNNGELNVNGRGHYTICTKLHAKLGR